MGFTREFMEVQAHGNTKLHMIHTNDLHKAATTIEQYERHLQFKRHKIVGVDVKYTFAGLSIDGDIEMLGHVGLEITHFVDIHKEWRVPTATKPLESLGEVSGILVHDGEHTNAEHSRWACMPLSMRHIEYAAKDAYAAYKIWSRLTIIQEGLCRAKLDKEQTTKHARSWGDYDY
ncbi:uncharacterized protein [Aegilops tauschii subsp. strangulata]|uniref:uncharacterized protein n=1 Tax=Aegilops tauschii subsp. strangulata TaxID=200361 RepID=UPI003CC8553B